MSKQSFVTGQVLTAQQVNDLQTNDFNQTVSAKTASYTLVAADKGTRITMSSTSATTITVNTGLFAAGDTLFIQNLNTGVSTITAGTATVDTSASLALAQHEGGTLYFTSAGVSTFFKAAGAAPAAGGGMTLINTGGTALTGASVSISSIPATYNNLQIVIINPRPSVDGNTIGIRYNNDSTANRYSSINANGTASASFGATNFDVMGDTDNTATQGVVILDVYNYANTSIWKVANSISVTPNATTSTNLTAYRQLLTYNQTTAISEINFFVTSGSMSGGTVYVYGVK
jgi:hypothetical protein